MVDRIRNQRPFSLIILISFISFILISNFIDETVATDTNINTHLSPPPNPPYIVSFFDKRIHSKPSFEPVSIHLTSRQISSKINSKPRIKHLNLDISNDIDAFLASQFYQFKTCPGIKLILNDSFVVTFDPRSSSNAFHHQHQIENQFSELESFWSTSFSELLQKRLFKLHKLVGKISANIGNGLVSTKNVNESSKSKQTYQEPWRNKTQVFQFLFEEGWKRQRASHGLVEWSRFMSRANGGISLTTSTKFTTVRLARVFLHSLHELNVYVKQWVSESAWFIRWGFMLVLTVFIFGMFIGMLKGVNYFASFLGIKQWMAEVVLLDVLLGDDEDEDGEGEMDDMEDEDDDEEDEWEDV